MNGAKWVTCDLACYKYFSWFGGHYAHYNTEVPSEARESWGGRADGAAHRTRPLASAVFSSLYLHVHFLWPPPAPPWLSGYQRAFWTHQVVWFWLFPPCSDSHLICQGLGNQIRELIRILSERRWIQAWESVPEHKSVDFCMPLTQDQLA